MRQLNTQINNLQKQAKQAEAYKSISEEITRLEGIVTYLKWYNLKECYGMCIFMAPHLNIRICASCYSMIDFDTLPR